MKSEQEFTASVHFDLPEGCHVWQPQIVTPEEGLKYRLQAKSKYSAQEARDKLRAAVLAIQRAVE